MSDLPKGWIECSLGDVVSIRYGANLPTNQLTHVGFPVYGANGKIGFYSRFTYEAPEVLITCRGATCGTINVSEPRSFVTNNSIVLQPKGPDLQRAFLRLSMLATDRSAVITGTAQPQITIANLEHHKILVAPPAEQERIVSRVESLTAKSRRAKEALDAVPALLERFRQSVLASAFRGDLTADWREKNPDVEPAEVLLKRIRAERRRRWEEAELAKMRAKGKVPGDDRWKEKYEEPEPVNAEGLPELPEGWCWASLGELAWTSGYGTSEKCDYDADGPVVLRIPNIAGGRIDLADVKRSLRREIMGADDALQAGDLLIVRTNGSKDLIGRGAVIVEELDAPTYFASYLIRFRLVKTDTLADWVSAIWAAPEIRRAIEQMAATSAGQYNVSMGNLIGIRIPIPPESEQAAIVRQLRTAAAGIERTEAALKDAHNQQVVLNRSILEKAFRGELVAQDPSDEPASVLLERLRGEGSSTTKEKPQKTGRRGAGARKASRLDDAG